MVLSSVKGQKYFTYVHVKRQH